MIVVTCVLWGLYIASQISIIMSITSHRVATVDIFREFSTRSAVIWILLDSAES